MLNLGSGYQPLPKPWINVDYKQAPNVDQIVDLNKDWPWKDNSVDQIFSSHAVEHLDSFVHFMRESQRVLKVGGWLEVRCPYGASDDAMADPFHTRPFYEGTFASFVKGYGTQDNPKQTLNPQYDEWPFTFVVRDVKFLYTKWIYRLPFGEKIGYWLKRYLNNIARNMQVLYQKT